jgi:LuxR family transcriptional regulator, maltose regulon positive regulatory protein
MSLLNLFPLLCSHIGFPLVATKLYIPPPRPKAVPRPRLIARLNEGLHRKLTLIAAPAGFGKTTLVSAWVAERQKVKGKRQNDIDDTLLPFTFSLLPFKVAWLSLDEGDSDPTRFLTYLVAAVQTIAPAIGAGVAAVLQSSQPPPTEVMLTALLNDITIIPDPFVLVLDDYHLLDATPVDHALAFLLDHQPPQLHLVITPLKTAFIFAEAFILPLLATTAPTFVDGVLGALPVGRPAKLTSAPSQRYMR